MTGPDSPAAAEVRAEVAAFLAARWRPAVAADPQQLAQFRRAAVDHGYLYRAVPRRFGGSERPPDPDVAEIVRQEFVRAGAIREAPGVGVALLVPTLLRWGTPDQQQRFIPPTVAGALRWCQGYSEPDAGSDLESLRTTAVLDGDDWVITGQKVWTSQAHRADWMFLLARTEPQHPRREGLSYLLLDMRSPGIDVRPLRQITGAADFNEVFLTGARTPHSMLVGERGGGWAVSRTTLSAERTTYAGAETSAALLASLVTLVRRHRIGGRPALDDPGVRRRLVALRELVEAQRCSAMLPAASTTMPLLNKLLHTQIAGEVSAIALDVLGPDSLLDPVVTGRAGDERWLGQFLGSLGVAIAGGTSNIQRTIVAERGLGLPRAEPVGAAHGPRP